MTRLNKYQEKERPEIRSWRDFPLMNVSIGNMLHNKTGTWRFIRPVYENGIPSCQDGCPAGNDIEGWIRLFLKEKYEEAFWHIKREEPFPSILGRVCFKFCESACNRNKIDLPVNIHALERFIGDEIDPSKPHPLLPEYHGKSLAIVGSGPAGMSAAYFARLLGFKVTIFEALEKPGGILRIGIPAYRLPKDILDREFKGLEAMDIEINTGQKVGKDISFEKLETEFDYIFIATGALKSRQLGLENEEESPRIMSALSMLKKIALNEKIDLGKKVAVIGGGNSAIDAARSALRLGCDVTIIYRRTQDEMPAHMEEIKEAKEEGVKFIFLAAPKKILFHDDGKVKSLICTEMVLGDMDESGRRRPIEKKGSEFEVEIDTLISAIGEQPDLTYLSKAVSITDSPINVANDLSIPVKDKAHKIFAGGDIINTPRTVIHAISEGKRAAIAMDCHRRGIDFDSLLSEISIGDNGPISFSLYKGLEPPDAVSLNNKKVVTSNEMNYDYFEEIDQEVEEKLEPSKRKTRFDPYVLSYSQEKAQKEAIRCMHCGRCIECDNCLIFCPDSSVYIKKNGQFGYEIDYDYCKGCGICYVECPRACIKMVPEEASSIETGN